SFATLRWRGTSAAWPWSRAGTRAPDPPDARDSDGGSLAMGLYLVTGGAGFIGSSIARALIARGDAVRIIDNFSTGKRENLADIAERIELYEGDIRDDRLLARAVAGVEVVFHEAAIASVPQSMA